jgi:hypothetical protein
MEFSISTFTVEINGVACAIFKTKWQSDAERIGRGWAQEQVQHISETETPRLPPLIRVRIARPSEEAAHNSAPQKQDYVGVEFVIISDVRVSLARA